MGILPGICRLGHSESGQLPHWRTSTTTTSNNCKSPNNKNSSTTLSSMASELSEYPSPFAASFDRNPKGSAIAPGEPFVWGAYLEADQDAEEGDCVMGIFHNKADAKACAEAYSPPDAETHTGGGVDRRVAACFRVMGGPLKAKVFVARVGSVTGTLTRGAFNSRASAQSWLQRVADSAGEGVLPLLKAGVMHCGGESGYLIEAFAVG